MHDEQRRRSTVLHPSHDLTRWLLSKIRPLLRGLLKEFFLSPGRIADIEVQVTASNDGDFYTMHLDNADLTRALSFVYFFHQAPPRFTGGLLRIRKRNGDLMEIEPLHNRLVFFSSDLRHEITPVQCPSKQFRDSRFTLNGWVHVGMSELDTLVKTLSPSESGHPEARAP